MTIIHSMVVGNFEQLNNSVFWGNKGREYKRGKKLQAKTDSKQDLKHLLVMVRNTACSVIWAQNMHLHILYHYTLLLISM